MSTFVYIDIYTFLILYCYAKQRQFAIKLFMTVMLCYCL